jgi:signal transduction histidine kinase
MKRNTYLPFSVAILISVLFGLLGSVLINDTSASKIKSIDQIFDGNIKDLGSAKDPLSAALLFSKNDEIPVSLGFRPSDSGLLILRDSSAAINRPLTQEEFAAAQRGAISLDTGTHNRIRAFESAPGEQIILAASLVLIESERYQQFRLLGALDLLLLVIALAVFLFFSRRNQVRIFAREMELEKFQRTRIQNFIGDASHELRTPLTVIKGYIELIRSKQDIDPEQQEKFLERVATETQRMEELISELLLLAELGERPEIDREIFDIASLANGFIDDLKVLQPERVITKEFSNPLMISGSPRLLAQLFSNIFSNARRHTAKSDAVELRIEKSKDFCTITYNDAGPGLPDEITSGGVSEFSRFDRSRSRATGGSGLGLSIVSAIVKAHAGEITFGKNAMGGLAITIKLPQ